MPDPNTTMIKATLLDPEDGESGIVEVMSGRVLGCFPSLRHAAQALRFNRPKYEGMIANADALHRPS
jgi:hypothetical protein